MKRYKELMKEVVKNEKFILLIMLLVLAFIPLISWFKKGYLIAGGDFFPPIFPVKLITESRFCPLYIWSDKLLGGMPSGLSVVKFFPFFAFWAFFKFLGLDVLVIQKLWFTSVFLFSGLSMYYLTSVIIPEKRYIIGRLVATLFYMFNPYLGLWCTIVSDSLILAYIFTPLFLGVFIKGLREERSMNKYTILFAILSVLSLTSVSNPPIYIVVWLPVIAYFIYYATCASKKKRLSALIFFSGAVSFVMLVNIWWIISFFTSFFLSGGITLSEGINLNWVAAKSGDSSILAILRFLGKWSFDKGFRVNGKLYLYYPHISLYSTSILILTTFLMPILAFFALVIKPRDKRIIFFVILSVVFIFLAKGLHSPLQFINKFLYIYIPGFIFFRESIAKFIPVVALCYSPLIGISLNEIYHYFLKMSYNRVYPTIGKVFLFFVISAIIVNGFSLITGKIIPSKKGPLPGSQVKIPSYWFEASNWVNAKDGDFRVLLTPRNSPNSVLYDWGYIGVDRTPFFMRKALITVYPAGGTGGYSQLKNADNLANLVYGNFSASSMQDIYQLLSLFNVKYILQRNDLDWARVSDSYKTVSYPDHIRSFLLAQPGIHIEKSFDKLDLYKISDEYFLPHIYASLIK